MSAAAPSSPLVALRGVTLRYPALQRADTPEILSGVDFAINAGESVAIVGPSGSGKSTILNIIGALLPPTKGVALYDGQDLGEMNADELAALRNREIGYIFQAHHLLPQCTALENVLVPTLVQKGRAGNKDTQDRACSLLREIGLGERMNHRPAQLSGGECQRVAVVRALINEPRLLLADEPTGSLDAEATEQMGELLTTLTAEHSLTLLTVTHSESLAARMQRRHELRNGKLHALGAVT